jgi:malonyl CoA-acyl carrier protein transacylase
MRFTDDVAIVTGAGSGIGRAVALRLAADGAAVACLDVNEQGVHDVAAQIDACGGQALPVVADVTRREMLEAALARTLEAYGKVTRLACVAGVNSPPEKFDTLTDDGWDRVMAINARGCFSASQVVSRAIAEAGGVTVANDNAPGQVVLSGSIDALDKTEAEANERNTRVIRLDVAGAFHSPAMEPSVAPFRAALDEVEVNNPKFTVFSGASARPFVDVRAELADALVKPVRWRETVIAMHEAGAPSFVEVGPGKVLARMGKRILKGVPFETPAEGLVHA